MNIDEWIEIDIERIRLEKYEIDHPWCEILYPDMADSLSD